MASPEKSNKSKFYYKAHTEDRLGFLVVFAVISLVFGLCYLLSDGRINLSSFGGCAFERNFGLPCPTCGMTRSITAFMQGNILNSLVLQPAGGIGCIVLAVTAFFSLLSALLGLNFVFLPPVRIWPIGRITLAAAAVFIIGWAIMLTKAFVCTQ
ncbi:MAG: DUF2752 domain-containing protein [Sedimentisphaerales bacterium]